MRTDHILRSLIPPDEMPAAEIVAGAADGDQLERDLRADIGFCDRDAFRETCKQNHELAADIRQAICELVDQYESLLGRV